MTVHQPIPVVPTPIGKRLLDIALSGVGLLVSSPIWAVLALLIRSEDKGPVFFGQERVGEGGRIFRVLKFRSMIVDGHEVEFTDGFADLHTRSYEEVLAGRGFGTADARPSIELVHRIRTAPVSSAPDSAHRLFAHR